MRSWRPSHDTLSANVWKLLALQGDAAAKIIGAFVAAILLYWPLPWRARPLYKWEETRWPLAATWLQPVSLDLQVMRQA